MGSISIWEIIVIVILIAVIFGGRRLPELGRGLGQGLANFRNAIKDKPESSSKTDQAATEEKPEDPSKS